MTKIDRIKKLRKEQLRKYIIDIGILLAICVWISVVIVYLVLNFEWIIVILAGSSIGLFFGLWLLLKRIIQLEQRIFELEDNLKE